MLSRLLARPAGTVSRNASVNALLRAQVITEVLHLSRNPEVVRQIADEKEKAFQRLRAGRPLAALPGSDRLLQTLVNHGVRVVFVRSLYPARSRLSSYVAGALAS